MLQRPRRTWPTLALLCLAAALLRSAATRPGPAPDAFSGRARCLLFARVSGPGNGLSNQLTSILRTAAVALRLGCRVLPVNIGPHGAAAAHIPLETYFDAGRVFADPSDPDDAAWILGVLARTAEGAGVPLPEPGGPLDRARQSIDPNANPLPLALPCLIDPASVGDSRSNATQPFRCSSFLVLEEWLTHPAPGMEDRPPTGIAARALWAATEGALLGIPAPYNLNVSCGLELAAIPTLRPRDELLRAAKWLLWNAVLPGRSASASEASNRLNTTTSMPGLSDPAYDSYPGLGPAGAPPVLVTAHIRASVDHQVVCRHWMRFPLCGTTAIKSSRFLVSRLRELGCSRGPPILLLAGETLGNPAFQDRPDATAVRHALAELSSNPCPPAVLYTGRDLAPLYPAVLSHPSLRFAVPQAAAGSAHGHIAAVLLDQMLLACGDYVGAGERGGGGGGFFQTRGSFVSARAWALGTTVGAEVCLPAGYAPPVAPPLPTADELAAEAAEVRSAGADFVRLFSAPGNARRRTLRPGEAASGCSARGRFLPSLTFAERDALPDEAAACPNCYQKERW